MGAFNRMILAHGYDAVRPAAIAKAAGVGRSTFYEHYTGKADLLAQSLTAVLTPLADAVLHTGPNLGAEAVMRHFRENRRLALTLLSGRPRIIMARRLEALIASRLGPLRRPGDLPPALAATQRAHGALALIEAWLSGRHGCSAAELAANLGGG